MSWENKMPLASDGSEKIYTLVIIHKISHLSTIETFNELFCKIYNRRKVSTNKVFLFI